jgi:hypothetical protein
MSRTGRRFPPPWRVIEKAGFFVVDDASGQRLGSFHYGHEDGAARHGSLLTRDEARRMAANFARLPELLGKADPS